eukprot:CAMPEP_0183765532 /NCGR_PEP_ID=MMETSP0739-20130205/11011_1 /TAXON_ID=385413 /ORGANISM="Thalassiosira miniscula, Strain CCMP1093" /LENGTH=85 /DNA_ID=CAMNT_0026004219 /DNA_START=205 /DNA_END=463 /DNA_ORIENTATION=+
MYGASARPPAAAARGAGPGGTSIRHSAAAGGGAGPKRTLIRPSAAAAANLIELRVDRVPPLVALERMDLRLLPALLSALERMELL